MTTGVTPVLGVEKRPARIWRIVLGAVLLAWSAGGLLAPIKPPSFRGDAAGGDAAGAMGTAVALATLAALAVAGVELIGSGRGQPGHAPSKGRIWFRLVGLGLAALVIVSSVLRTLSLSFVADLVTIAYFLGWTWLSWFVAGRMVKTKGESRRQLSDNSDERIGAG